MLLCDFIRAEVSCTIKYGEDTQEVKCDNNDDDSLDVLLDNKEAKVAITLDGTITEINNMKIACKDLSNSEECNKNVVIQSSGLYTVDSLVIDNFGGEVSFVTSDSSKLIIRNLTIEGKFNLNNVSTDGNLNLDLSKAKMDNINYLTFSSVSNVNIIKPQDIEDGSIIFWSKSPTFVQDIENTSVLKLSSVIIDEDIYRVFYRGDPHMNCTYSAAGFKEKDCGTFSDNFVLYDNTEDGKVSNNGSRIMFASFYTTKDRIEVSGFNFKTFKLTSNFVLKSAEISQAKVDKKIQYGYIKDVKIDRLDDSYGNYVPFITISEGQITEKQAGYSPILVGKTTNQGSSQNVYRYSIYNNARCTYSNGGFKEFDCEQKIVTEDGKFILYLDNSRDISITEVNITSFTTVETANSSVLKITSSPNIFIESLTLGEGGINSDLNISSESFIIRKLIIKKDPEGFNYIYNVKSTELTFDNTNTKFVLCNTSKGGRYVNVKKGEYNRCYADQQPNTKCSFNEENGFTEFDCKYSNIDGNNALVDSELMTFELSSGNTFDAKNMEKWLNLNVASSFTSTGMTVLDSVNINEEKVKVNVLKIEGNVKLGNNISYAYINASSVRVTDLPVGKTLIVYRDDGNFVGINSTLNHINIGGKFLLHNILDTEIGCKFTSSTEFEQYYCNEASNRTGLKFFGVKESVVVEGGYTFLTYSGPMGSKSAQYAPGNISLVYLSLGGSFNCKFNKIYELKFTSIVNGYAKIELDELVKVNYGSLQGIVAYGNIASQIQSSLYSYRIGSMNRYSTENTNDHCTLSIKDNNIYFSEPDCTQGVFELNESEIHFQKEIEMSPDGQYANCYIDGKVKLGKLNCENVYLEGVGFDISNAHINTLHVNMTNSTFNESKFSGKINTVTVTKDTLANLYLFSGYLIITNPNDLASKKINLNVDAYYYKSGEVDFSTCTYSNENKKLEPETCNLDGIDYQYYQLTISDNADISGVDFLNGIQWESITIGKNVEGTSGDINIKCKELTTSSNVTFGKIMVDKLNATGSATKVIVGSKTEESRIRNYESDNTYFLFSSEKVGSYSMFADNLYTVGVESNVCTIKGSVFDESYCNILNEELMDPTKVKLVITGSEEIAMNHFKSGTYAEVDCDNNKRVSGLNAIKITIKDTVIMDSVTCEKLIIETDKYVEVSGNIDTISASVSVTKYLVFIQNGKEISSLESSNIYTDGENNKYYYRFSSGSLVCTIESVEGQVKYVEDDCNKQGGVFNLSNKVILDLNGKVPTTSLNISQFNSVKIPASEIKVELDCSFEEVIVDDVFDLKVNSLNRLTFNSSINTYTSKQKRLLTTTKQDKGLIINNIPRNVIAFYSENEFQSQSLTKSDRIGDSYYRYYESGIERDSYRNSYDYCTLRGNSIVEYDCLYDVFSKKSNYLHVNQGIFDCNVVGGRNMNTFDELYIDANSKILKNCDAKNVILNINEFEVESCCFDTMILKKEVSGGYIKDYNCKDTNRLLTVTDESTGENKISFYSNCTVPMSSSSAYHDVKMSETYHRFSKDQTNVNCTISNIGTYEEYDCKNYEEEPNTNVFLVIKVIEGIVDVNFRHVDNIVFTNSITLNIKKALKIKQFSSVRDKDISFKGENVTIERLSAESNPRHVIDFEQSVTVESIGTIQNYMLNSHRNTGEVSTGLHWVTIGKEDNYYRLSNIKDLYCNYNGDYIQPDCGVVSFSSSNAILSLDATCNISSTSTFSRLEVSGNYEIGGNGIITVDTMDSKGYYINFKKQIKVNENLYLKRCNGIEQCNSMTLVTNNNNLNIEESNANGTHTKYGTNDTALVMKGTIVGVVNCLNQDGCGSNEYHYTNNKPPCTCTMSSATLNALSYKENHDTFVESNCEISTNHRTTLVLPKDKGNVITISKDIDYLETIHFNGLKGVTFKSDSNEVRHVNIYILRIGADDYVKFDKTIIPNITQLEGTDSRTSYLVGDEILVEHYQNIEIISKILKESGEPNEVDRCRISEENEEELYRYYKRGYGSCSCKYDQNTLIPSICELKYSKFMNLELVSQMTIVSQVFNTVTFIGKGITEYEINGRNDVFIKEVNTTVPSLILGINVRKLINNNAKYVEFKSKDYVNSDIEYNCNGGFCFVVNGNDYESNKAELHCHRCNNITRVIHGSNDRECKCYSIGPNYVDCNIKNSDLDFIINEPINEVDKVWYNVEVNNKNIRFLTIMKVTNELKLTNISDTFVLNSSTSATVGSFVVNHKGYIFVDGVEIKQYSTNSVYGLLFDYVKNSYSANDPRTIVCKDIGRAYSDPNYVANNNCSCNKYTTEGWLVDCPIHSNNFDLIIGDNYSLEHDWSSLIVSETIERDSYITLDLNGRYINDLYQPSHVRMEVKCSSFGTKEIGLHVNGENYFLWSCQDLIPTMRSMKYKNGYAFSIIGGTKFSGVEYCGSSNNGRIVDDIKCTCSTNEEELTDNAFKQEDCRYYSRNNDTEFVNMNLRTKNIKINAANKIWKFNRLDISNNIEVKGNLSISSMKSFSYNINLIEGNMRVDGFSQTGSSIVNVTGGVLSVGTYTLESLNNRFFVGEGGKLIFTSSISTISGCFEFASSVGSSNIVLEKSNEGIHLFNVNNHLIVRNCNSSNFNLFTCKTTIEGDNFDNMFETAKIYYCPCSSSSFGVDNNYTCMYEVGTNKVNMKGHNNLRENLKIETSGVEFISDSEITLGDLSVSSEEVSITTNSNIIVQRAQFKTMKLLNNYYNIKFNTITRGVSLISSGNGLITINNSSEPISYDCSNIEFKENTSIASLTMGNNSIRMEGKLYTINKIILNNVQNKEITSLQLINVSNETEIILTNYRISDVLDPMYSVLIAKYNEPLKLTESKEYYKCDNRSVYLIGGNFDTEDCYADGVYFGSSYSSFFPSSIEITTNQSINVEYTKVVVKHNNLEITLENDVKKVSIEGNSNELTVKCANTSLTEVNINLNNVKVRLLCSSTMKVVGGNAVDIIESNGENVVLIGGTFRNINARVNSSGYVKCETATDVVITSGSFIASSNVSRVDMINANYFEAQNVREYIGNVDQMKCNAPIKDVVCETISDSNIDLGSSKSYINYPKHNCYSTEGSINKLIVKSDSIEINRDVTIHSLVIRKNLQIRGDHKVTIEKVSYEGTSLGTVTLETAEANVTSESVPIIMRTAGSVNCISLLTIETEKEVEIRGASNILINKINHTTFKDNVNRVITFQNGIKIVNREPIISFDTLNISNVVFQGTIFDSRIIVSGDVVLTANSGNGGNYNVICNGKKLVYGVDKSVAHCNVDYIEVTNVASNGEMTYHSTSHIDSCKLGEPCSMIIDNNNASKLDLGSKFNNVVDMKITTNVDVSISLPKELKHLVITCKNTNSINITKLYGSKFELHNCKAYIESAQSSVSIIGKDSEVTCLNSEFLKVDVNKLVLRGSNKKFYGQVDVGQLVVDNYGGYFYDKTTIGEISGKVDKGNKLFTLMNVVSGFTLRDYTIEVCFILLDVTGVNGQDLNVIAMPEGIVENGKYYYGNNCTKEDLVSISVCDVDKTDLTTYDVEDSSIYKKTAVCPVIGGSVQFPKIISSDYTITGMGMKNFASVSLNKDNSVTLENYDGSSTTISKIENCSKITFKSPVVVHDLQCEESKIVSKVTVNSFGGIVEVGNDGELFISTNQHVTIPNLISSKSSNVVSGKHSILSIDTLDITVSKKSTAPLIIVSELKYISNISITKGSDFEYVELAQTSTDLNLSKYTLNVQDENCNISSQCCGKLLLYSNKAFNYECSGFYECKDYTNCGCNRTVGTYYPFDFVITESGNERINMSTNVDFVNPESGYDRIRLDGSNNILLFDNGTNYYVYGEGKNNSIICNGTCTLYTYTSDPIKLISGKFVMKHFIGVEDTLRSLISVSKDAIVNIVSFGNILDVKNLEGSISVDGGVQMGELNLTGGSMKVNYDFDIGTVTYREGNITIAKGKKINVGTVNVEKTINNCEDIIIPESSDIDYIISANVEIQESQHIEATDCQNSKLVVCPEGRLRQSKCPPIECKPDDSRTVCACKYSDSTEQVCILKCQGSYKYTVNNVERDTLYQSMTNDGSYLECNYEVTLLEYSIEKDFEFNGSARVKIGKLNDLSSGGKLLMNDVSSFDLIQLVNEKSHLDIENEARVRGIEITNAQLTLNSVVEFEDMKQSIYSGDEEDIPREIKLKDMTLNVGPKGKIILGLVPNSNGDDVNSTVIFDNVKINIDRNRDNNTEVISMLSEGTFEFTHVEVEFMSSETTEKKCYILSLKNSFGGIIVTGGNVMYDPAYSHVTYICDEGAEVTIPELSCKLTTSYNSSHEIRDTDTWNNKLACPCERKEGCIYDFRTSEDITYSTEESCNLTKISGKNITIKSPNTNVSEVVVTGAKASVELKHIGKLIINSMDTETTVKLGSTMTIGKVEVIGNNSNPTLDVTSFVNLSDTAGVNLRVTERVTFEAKMNASFEKKKIRLVKGQLFIYSDDINFTGSTIYMKISAGGSYLINFNDTVSQNEKSLETIREVNQIYIEIEGKTGTVGVIRLPENVKINMKDKIQIGTSEANGMKTAREWHYVETCHGVVFTTEEKESDIECPRDVIGHEKEKKFPYYVLVFVVMIVVILVIVIVIITLYVVHVIRIRKRNTALFEKGEEVVDSEEDMNEKKENEDINSVAIQAPVVAENAAKDEELSKSSSKLSKSSSKLSKTESGSQSGSNSGSSSTSSE